MKSALKERIDQEMPTSHLSSLPRFEESDAETVYCAGFALYEAERFHDAIDQFTTALHINPLRTTYWQALGCAKMMAKNYIEAARAFAAWSLLETENPLPHFHAAECFLSAGNIEEGICALKESKKRIHPDEENLLLQKIELLEEEYSHVAR